MPATTIDPRYPIGKYEPQPFSEKQKLEWLNDIKFLPLFLENAVAALMKLNCIQLTVMVVGRYNN